MKALVTGGAGFIGSHLCERLLDRGDEVICVDNLVTGQRDNVAGLVSRPGFHFAEQDVSVGLSFDSRVDAVFHLASPASPRGYLDHPLETALVNSYGTRNALECARQHGARFLLASTSEAYGDPLIHPQPETYWGNVNPVGMRACYDESKRFGEMLTTVYVRQCALDARIVRIFNCYGPRSHPLDGRIIPNFVTQALRSEPMTVYEPGTQTRSLCFVSDLVTGLIKALETTGTVGRVYNLGNPDERTVLEFAQTIRRLAGSRSEIVFQPQISEDDPKRRCPDITRARQELGWEPRVSLDEGLTATIDWFRSRLGLVPEPSESGAAPTTG